MRRSLALRALLISLLIVVVFSVPLMLGISRQARTRALTLGRSDARALGPIVSVSGDPRVPGAIANVASRATPRQVSVVFPDGSVLGSGAVIYEDRLVDPASFERAQRGESFENRVRDGVVIYEPVPRSNGTTAVVRVLVPDSQLRRGVARSWALVALLGSALVALAVFVSDRIGRSVVRSVGSVSDVALTLARGDLTARAEPDGPPEVREVGQSLNALADRIDELIGSERAAAADLSHRLRTPVTALRAEVGLLSTGEQRARIEASIDELSRTIDSIIRDAQQPVRAGIGIVSDLGQVVRARTLFWSVLAEDQHRRLLVSVPEEPLLTSVAERDLAAAVDAIIDNVFSHTEEGTAFRVEVTSGGDVIDLVVDDDGEGFPTGFGLARGSSSKGSTGIGLDMVRRVAEGAGGQLSVLTRSGRGGRVRLELPRVPAASAS
jgi:signal transduction histidine kinase